MHSSEHTFYYKNLLLLELIIDLANAYESIRFYVRSDIVIGINPDCHNYKRLFESVDVKIYEHPFARTQRHISVCSFIQTFKRINADLQPRSFTATNRDSLRQCEAT